MTTDPTDFDPEHAVERYREVIELRDAQTDELGRAEYQAIADRLKAAWKDWNGGDDSELHEVAFG